MINTVASTQVPTVHPVYLRLLTDALEERGHDVDSVLAAADLRAADIGATAPPVDFRKVVLLLQHIVSITADPYLAVSWGNKIKPAVHGTVGTAVFSASTLREALQVWARLLPLRASAFQLELTEVDRIAHFEFKSMPSMAELDEFIATVVGFVSMQVIQALIGKRVSKMHVTFPFPVPPWAADRDGHCPCEVTFGSKTLDFQLPVELLDLPCPFADARTHEAAVRQAELDKLSANEGLSERVTAYLSYCDSVCPTLDEVANRFFMSSRTLRRQLQGEGTSYQTILDRVRMDRARVLLKDTDLSIQQVTDKLGYGDPSNFSRAFRRHHGCTPKQYRENVS